MQVVGTEDSMDFDAKSFQPGHVSAVQHPRFLQQMDKLIAKFPAAALHRQALRLMGSDFVDARQWNGPGERGYWTALIRFGRIIEGSLGLTREVMALYSSDRDLQLREFTKLPYFRDKQPRKPTQDLFLVYSPDLITSNKLNDWAIREPFGAVSLPRLGPSPEEAAVMLLRGLTDRLSSRNLYEETLPVTGRDFFGRRDLLMDLTEQLRRGKVCGIFGLRKTGKTSLVTELGERFVISDPERRLFVLRDLEDLPTDYSKHIQALQLDLTTSLLPKLRSMGLRTHEFTQLTDSSSIGEFRRAMQATLGHERSREIQMVIALDEIESLVGPGAQTSTDRPHVPEFLGVLRSLVQENPNFNVVISGLTSTVLQSGILYGRENPLFAWAKPYYMPPLDREAADRLVEQLGQRMALRWTPEALSEVFALTDGHVFLQRTLCARVAAGLPRDLSHRTVTDTIVRQTVRPWRRGVAEQIREMMLALQRFYPDAAEVLGLLSAGDITSDEADIAYPSETELLVRLGLISEQMDSYALTAFSRMARRL